MKDLVIGLAMGYDWPQVEAFAVSLVRSGYTGAKVLFVKDLKVTARDNLQALGFELIEIPNLDYSEPDMPLRRYFPYVGRFLLIHRYLEQHPGYRFVVCADIRDVVFQHDPAQWLERNIGNFGLVAASEFTRHRDQSGNYKWIVEGFKEIGEWMLPKIIYCSGVMAGRAEYIRDLSLGIYVAGRYISDTMWGVDQPTYNTIMHQKAYADITLVPTLHDCWCINLVNFSISSQGAMLFDTPDPAPFDTYGEPLTRRLDLLWNNGLANLDRMTILHQYDRIPPLAAQLRTEYRLENLEKVPLRLRLSSF